MNKCEDIFTECSFKSYNISCCDHFFPVFTEIGFCYAFNSRLYEIKPPNSNKTYPKFEMKYIQETDLKWSLKFGVKNPVNPILVRKFKTEKVTTYFSYILKRLKSITRQKFHSSVYFSTYFLPLKIY